MIPRELAQLGIIVPTLNAASTLRATLESVRDAVDHGASAIIVDGGSQDDTITIGNSYGIPSLAIPGTMYTAINAGVAALETPWLTWINADDIIYVDALIRRLRDAGPADVVYGTVDFIDRAGRFVHCWRSARSQDLLPLYRAGYSPVLQQGVLFRRTVFESIGGFDATLRFVGDADFWWRALEKGFQFARHPWPPAGAFRLHPNQLSQRYASAMHTEHSLLRNNRARISRLDGFARMVRYRLENISAYMIRLLRRPFIDGKWRPSKSNALT